MSGGGSSAALAACRAGMPASTKNGAARSSCWAWAMWTRAAFGHEWREELLSLARSAEPLAGARSLLQQLRIVRRPALAEEVVEEVGLEKEGAPTEVTRKRTLYLHQ